MLSVGMIVHGFLHLFFSRLLAAMGARFNTRLEVFRGYDL